MQHTAGDAAKNRIAQTMLARLGYYPGAIDGAWGPLSQAAAAAWATHQEAPATPLPPSALPDFACHLDNRSESNIATLLPVAQAAARRFMVAAIPAMAAAGTIIQIICGSRTYAAQDALYAQGRTLPGHIVTNAPGGYSNHNFGIAWDIGLFRGKIYLEESPLYLECAKIGRDQGLDCGAFWSALTDEPHYNLKTGLTLEQMRIRMANGQAIV